MERTQEATALAINSSNLQQIALNASDARITLDMETDNLNFRKEISRIIGVYVEPGVGTVTLDGITFFYGNDKDSRQRSLHAEIETGANGKSRIVRGKITSLSDIGALILEADELRVPSILVYDNPGVMLDDSVRDAIATLNLGDEFIFFLEEVLFLADAGQIAINCTISDRVEVTVDVSPLVLHQDVRDCLNKFKPLAKHITVYVK